MYLHDFSLNFTFRYAGYNFDPAYNFAFYGQHDIEAVGRNTDAVRRRKRDINPLRANHGRWGHYGAPWWSGYGRWSYYGRPHYFY